MSYSASQASVAIQGERGSNSELAALEYFGADIALVACSSFEELFEAVRGGSASFGMAPVDNSLAGSIHEVWDLFLRSPLPVVGELSLRIGHCLIGNPAGELPRIRRISSHPQALAQCEGFLSTLEGVELQEVYDTAGAVAMVKGAGKLEDAAIAPAQAAADHGMKVLASAIESRTDNYTRFLVIAGVPGESRSGEMKTSAVIRLAESARGLGEILTCLTSRQLRLHKVESRKRLGEPYLYDVYVDFSGAVGEEAVDQALAEAQRIAACVTVIGSYPKGRRVEPRLHPVDR
ncbi:MAG: bifunctional chorismate mutase/prephenate dehydratase [Gemmatimonadetes bacterium]|nr:bifunctional chorismate mutase/prephenate dehydratase [Gemmatimonadota bacterium]